MSDSKSHFKTSVRRQTLIGPNKGYKKICIFLMNSGYGFDRYGYGYGAGYKKMYLYPYPRNW